MTSNSTTCAVQYVVRDGRLASKCTYAGRGRTPPSVRTLGFHPLGGPERAGLSAHFQATLLLAQVKVAMAVTALKLSKFVVSGLRRSRRGNGQAHHGWLKCNSWLNCNSWLKCNPVTRGSSVIP